MNNLMTTRYYDCPFVENANDELFDVFNSENYLTKIANLYDYDGELYKLKKTIYNIGYLSSALGNSYGCVVYKEGHIAVQEISFRDDAISSEFSGCYMATFEYNNKKYVAHIAKEKNGIQESTIQWNCAVEDGLLANVKLFKPSDYIDVHPPQTDIWGLITSYGEYYTIDTGVNKKDMKKNLGVLDIPSGYPKLKSANTRTLGII